MKKHEGSQNQEELKQVEHLVWAPSFRESENMNSKNIGKQISRQKIIFLKMAKKLPKLFSPEAYSAIASPKLCKFI